MLLAHDGREGGLDFTRRFLPESLARAESLAGFLSPVERLTLNHIRGRAYVCLTGRLEELCLGSPALGAFADGTSDEARLLDHLREDFDRGFGSRCGVVALLGDGPGSRRFRHPLSQALAVCHLAGAAERHYRDGIRDDRDLDARFRSLLVHRFKKTAGHARLHTGIDPSRRPFPDERGSAIEEFLGVLSALEADLERQVGVDLESLERAIGRELSEKERDLFRATQGPANRWTYLGSGLSEPGFLAVAGQLGPAVRDRVVDAAAGRR